MRWCFALAGLVLLMACQQPSGTGSSNRISQPGEPTLGEAIDALPEDWSGSDASKTSKYFPVEQAALTKRLAAGLVVNCYRHVGDKTAMDACLREGVVDTFDDTGQGRSNCQSVAELDPFSDCVIVGNAAVEMLQRFGDSGKVDGSLWTGRRALAELMSKAIITGAVMACSDSATEASAAECAGDWYQEKLAVPEKLAKKCTPNLSDRERAVCLTEAAIIRFVEDHMSRMPGTAI
jgi:hypothetical protein